jgi:hypothetical protein
MKKGSEAAISEAARQGTEKGMRAESGKRKAKMRGRKEACGLAGR